MVDTAELIRKLHEALNHYTPTFALSKDFHPESTKYSTVKKITVLYGALVQYVDNDESGLRDRAKRYVIGLSALMKANEYIRLEDEEQKRLAGERAEEPHSATLAAVVHALSEAAKELDTAGMEYGAVSSALHRAILTLNRLRT